MSLAPPLFRLVLPAAILALITGCARLDLKKPISWPLSFEEKPGTPEKVVAIWTHAIQYKPNQPPTRGFGGRLMFYGRDPDKPIKVDGSLVVYAFDESGPNPHHVKPDRKYVFPRDVFDKHYSESGVGHSYSFWVPWDAISGYQKEISLLVRFLPANGPEVIGEQTKHILPGAPVPTPGNRAELAGQSYNATQGQTQVQPTSYEAPTPMGPGAGQPDRDPPHRMSTTTIPIPPRFGSQRPVAAVRPRAAVRGVTPQQAAPDGGAVGNPARLQTLPPAQAGPGAAIPVREAQPPPQARYSPAQRQAPGGQSAQPTPDRSRWQRRLGVSPSYPGPRLQQARPSAPAANPTAAGPTSY